MAPDHEQEVTLFKELLRIKTMHPTPDLEGCVAWLTKQAEALKLELKVLRYVQDWPVVVMSRIGTEPHLPSIGLYCHMDVVAVDAARWTALPPGETPFSAYESPDSHKIYARGAQDMKSLGAQHLCALRRLAKAPLRRTIHFVWAPDEETDGSRGMKPFTQSPEFHALNLGCWMDEGSCQPDNKYTVYTGERTMCKVRFDADGVVGHGAKLPAGTATERLMLAAGKLIELRNRSVRRLAENPSLRLPDVTSYNITVFEAGVTSDGGKTFALNVIPASAYLVCDVRFAADDFTSALREIHNIAKTYDLKLSYPVDFVESDGPSPSSDTNTVWMKTILQTLAKRGVPVEPVHCAGATDSLFVRRAGKLAYGFSPMRLTPPLAHDHNEYMGRDTYLEGIDVVTELISALASVPSTAGSKL